MTWQFLQADAARLPFADDSVDLVIGSPPYCDARSYGIGAQRGLVPWIEWMLQVTREAVRVSRGLVLWVCAGVTRKWCYWPGPEGLLFMWKVAGGHCWRPAYWHRVGICGGGGRQWLRPDMEYVLAFTKCLKAIPWADNTANGHPPKWAPGGEMSYRLTEGERRNQWGSNHRSDSRGSNEADPSQLNKGQSPSHKLTTKKEASDTKRRKGMRRCARGSKDGDVVMQQEYTPPVLANPGNLVQGIPVGGGLLGHPLAHENEAPYPVKLAKYFIRMACPEGGLVLDPFIGSGTTAQAAIELHRNVIGCDIRLTQCQLSERRTATVQPDLF